MVFLKKWWASNWQISTLILLTIALTQLVAYLTFSQSQTINWGWEGTLYYIFYGYITAGKMPYIDFYIEYPPVVAYLIGGIGIWVKSMTNLQFLVVYAWGVGIWILGYFVGMQLLAKNKMLMLRILYITLLLIAINVALVYPRYDIFAGILTCLGLALFVNSIQNNFKNKILMTVGLACVIIAISFKVYPVLFLPIMALALFRAKQFWTLIPTIIILIVVTLINGYFIINGMERFRGTWEQQTARDIQIESSWAGGIMILEITTNLPVKIQLQNGAMEIYNDYAKSLARITTIFTLSAIVLILVGFGVRFWTQIWDKKFGIEFWADKVVYSSLLLISIFVFLNKTFSPQYLIWIFSLIPLLGLINYQKNSKKIRMVVYLILVISLLTLGIYPFNYSGLIDRGLISVIILNVRNVLFVPLIIVLFDLVFGKGDDNMITIGEK